MYVLRTVLVILLTIDPTILERAIVEVRTSMVGMHIKCNAPLHERGIAIDDSPVFDKIFHKGCRHPDVFRITAFEFLSDCINIEQSNRDAQRGRPTNALLLARDTILFISRMKSIGVHSRNTARQQAPHFSSNIDNE